MRASTFRTFWLPVLLMTLIATFFGAVLAHRGGDWDNLLAEKAALQVQLGELEVQNAHLKAQRDQLLSSPEAIERVAREDYGFAAPGEKVETVNPRPVARALPAQAPAGGRFPTLVWARMPIVLPLAVFVVSAFVFALLNILSGTGKRGKESQ